MQVFHANLYRLNSSCTEEYKRDGNRAEGWRETVRMRGKQGYGSHQRECHQERVGEEEICKG